MKKLTIATLTHGAHGGASMGRGIDALPASLQGVVRDLFRTERAGSYYWLSLDQRGAARLVAVLGGNVYAPRPGTYTYWVPAKIPPSRIKRLFC